MPSINSNSHSVAHTAPLTAPLLPDASTSVPHLTRYAETETAEHTALATRNAYRLASGSTMRRILNAAMDRIPSPTSAYDRTINIGSAVINTSLATLLHLGSFARETVTGVEHVDGHKVSGREDSLLKFPQRLIPAAVKELFTPDERISFSTKGFEFMKKAGTYTGGVAASFLYQMAIVGISDGVGRLCAQAIVDEFEKGNFAVPLAATTMLTILSATQQRYLLQSIKHFNSLKAEQKSAVIASHHGITPEAFNAKPETEREELGNILKRDWLVMGGASGLVSAAALGTCAFAAVYPTTAVNNPLFKALTENLIKVAVRSPVYGGLREALQEIFTGPKGGVADLTHAETGWTAIKYGAISTGVNIGQNAAQQFVHNLFNNPHVDLTPGSALTLASPPTSDWLEKACVLLAYAGVNAIGESINWADSVSDRTKKRAEIAKKDLIEQHEAFGISPPTPEELKEVAGRAEFSFNFGVKKQTPDQALLNMGRRGGGPLYAREGVYAIVNAISNAVSKTESGIEGLMGVKSSGEVANVVNNLILGFTTIFSYVKFNACSQSMGELRAIRAKDEREAEAAEREALDPHLAERHLINAIDAQEGSSRGTNLGRRSASVRVNNALTIQASEIRAFSRKRSFSIDLHELEHAQQWIPNRADPRVMSDF